MKDSSDAQYFIGSLEEGGEPLIGINYPDQGCITMTLDAFYELKCLYEENFQPVTKQGLQ